MHIYVLSRGIKHVAERFWNDLSAKYVPFPITNKKTGKVYMSTSQVHIRPIELHEIAFPKEMKDIVASTLFPAGMKYDSKMKRIVGFVKKLLMKPLGIKPLDFKLGKQKLAVAGMDGKGMERIPIGMKDDVMMDLQLTPKQLKEIGLPPNAKYESEGI